MTQETSGTPFNKDREDHITMVKSLYYAWYGPKDAQEYMCGRGIEVSVGRLTHLFYTFRAARIPRADRNTLINQYISGNTSHSAEV